MSGIEKWFEKLVEEGKIPQTPMNYDTASYKMYVAHLESENTALRERLEKTEHRAEVAEMALQLMARGECTFASPEYYREQAEKELSEEKK